MATASFWTRTGLFIMASALAHFVRADEPKQAPARPSAAPKGEAEEVAEALRDAWPDHPEWVDMLAAILDDEPMGPKYGWFRTAVAQTRFDWELTRKRLDRNGDGRIERPEFPGGDADLRGSTATTTKPFRPRISTSRAARWLPAQVPWSIRESIATATARSHVMSSRLSSKRLKAAARGFSRFPTCKRSSISRPERGRDRACPRRRLWFEVSFARRSGRFSRDRSSMNPRPTSRSRPTTARPRSRCPS